MLSSHKPLVLLSAVVAMLMMASLSGLELLWLPSTGLLFIALLALLLCRVALDAKATRGPWLGLDEILRRQWFEAGLITVAVFGLGVRLVGIGIGLGHEGIDIDEGRLARSVLQYFRTGALGHLTSEDHPGLHFWFLTASCLGAYLWGLMTGVVRDIDQTPIELFVWAGRSMNAVLGAVTTLLTGLLGRSAAGPAAGIIAAVLMAVAPLSLETSTQLRNDVGLVFFVTACAYAAQLAYAAPHRLPALAVGVLAGCATGTKYTGVFTLLPATLAGVLPVRGRQRWVHVGLSLAGFALAVAVTNHFVWADFPNFVRQLSMDFSHVGEGHWAATDNARLAYTSVLADEGVGWPLLVLAAGYAAFGLATKDPRSWVLSAFPLAYLWFMTNKPAMFPRWVYPLLPFVAVAGAAGLMFLVTQAARVPGTLVGGPLRLGRILAGGVVLAILSPALWTGVVPISRRFTPPTYALAEAWLDAQASPGDRVLTAPNMLLNIRGSRRGVRRVNDLKQALGGGRLQLYAHNWIVVPEKFFGHPGLAGLSLVKEFAADYGFGGNRGGDLRIYVPPALDLHEVTTIAMSSPDADEFLGLEWVRDAGRPGLELPNDGASVYLPAFTRDGARLELEVVTAQGTGATGRSPVDLTVEGVAIPLDVVSAIEGRTLLRSHPIPSRLPAWARKARILALRFDASSPIRVVSLSIR